MLPCFKFTMPRLSAYSLLLFTYAQVASGGQSFCTFWLTLPVSWCHNQRRLLQLQVSGISFSGYHWLPLDSSSFDLKNWMPLDVLVTDTLYSIPKVRQKTNFWSAFLLSKSLLLPPLNPHSSYKTWLHKNFISGLHRFLSGFCWY